MSTHQCYKCRTWFDPIRGGMIGTDGRPWCGKCGVLRSGDTDPGESAAFIYHKRYAMAKSEDPSITVDTFARYAVAHWPKLTLAVLELIGCWPSSEPELAALQRCWR